jgi:F0F1-type ATP synthase membrane subunit c/vacuolar-type H+-ATPase subunit K
MEYLYGIYLAAIVLFVLCLTVTSSYIFTYVTRRSHNSLFYQPYSQDIIKKNYMLALVFFETPTILAAIAGFFMMSLLKSSLGYVGILILIYSVCMIVIACATQYASNNIAKKFFRVFAAQPLYASANQNAFLVYLSIIQTPLLLSMIALLMGCNHAKDLIESGMSYMNVIFLSGLLIGLVSAGVGAIGGIVRISNAYTDVVEFHPGVIKSLIPRTILSIGLVEAPVIFSLLVYIILYKGVYNDSVIHLYGIIVSAIIFGVTAGISSYLSGKSAGDVIVYNTDEANIKRFSSIALFSQMLIDTRVLYLFIIIIFCIVHSGLLR